MKRTLGVAMSNFYRRNSAALKLLLILWVPLAIVVLIQWLSLISG